MEWKYKITLKTTNIFSEIEQERKIVFPDDLKKFIVEANAATPANYNFMVGNNERVFGAVLSFNRNEPDSDSVFTALAIITNTNLIPFGIDPFGNYICYSLADGKILFWDHESEDLAPVSDNLASFLASLY